MVVHSYKPIDTSPDIVRCPSCGSRDVRKSQMEKLLDNLMKSVRLDPFRCRCCQKRFYTRLQRVDELNPRLAGPLQVEQSF